MSERRFYLQLDDTGLVIARYDTDYEAPPEGAILFEIPDQATLLKCTQPGTRVVEGVITYLDTYLAECRYVLLGQIGIAHATAVHSDIEFSGVVYQADTRSFSKMKEAVAMHSTGLPSDFYWISKDNTRVPVTDDYMKRLIAAIAARNWNADKLFHERTLEVKSAASVDDLLALEKKYGI